jgi:SAM-dependent methyltransferase
MFSTLLSFCGQLESPGIAVDFSQYSDFSMRETTEDQARIEDVLAAATPAESKVLHVGVGNSKFAQRFHGDGCQVVGITVSDEELRHAESLDIDGYRMLKLNKYSREFTRLIEDKYFDFVVDNNIAAFACCKYHFYLMLDNYLQCLKPGGKILTDQRGLDWSLLDPSFILSFEDLQGFEKQLPLAAKRETEMVYSLQRTAPGAALQALKVHALRRKPDGNVVETFEPQSNINTTD